MHHYKVAGVISIIALALAFVVGSIAGLISACILAVLEISLSFDNCIVNAKVLKTMSHKWQERFVTWGMVVAVFGMRVVFPILVVCIVGAMDPITALHLALKDPIQYAHYLEISHTALMAFGGTFLMLVASEFFFDDGGVDFVWLPIEKIFSKAPKLFKFILVEGPIIFYLIFECTQQYSTADGFDFHANHNSVEFILGAVIGFIAFSCIHFLSEKMEESEEKKTSAGTAVAAGGLSMFIYLEVLDSSFSFDGVIGAFAISNNIFIIAIGLGIGALFVRSMTLDFVEKGTLNEFKFLEHGAFYSILALAIIMLLKTQMEVPEVITGGISMLFIGAAFIHSIILNKNKLNQTTEGDDVEILLPESKED